MKRHFQLLTGILRLGYKSQSWESSLLGGYEQRWEKVIVLHVERKKSNYSGQRSPINSIIITGIMWISQYHYTPDKQMFWVAVLDFPAEQNVCFYVLRVAIRKAASASVAITLMLTTHLFLTARGLSSWNTYSTRYSVHRGASVIALMNKT